MNTLDTSQLVTVLQQAVGPVVRIVDRSRALAHQARVATGEEQDTARAQLRILGQRAGLVRWAILLAGFCVLFIALLVISLFVTALFGVGAAWLIAGFFIVSLLCLIGSLVMFIRDINKSLNATALEVGEDWKRK